MIHICCHLSEPSLVRERLLPALTKLFGTHQVCLSNGTGCAPDAATQGRVLLAVFDGSGSGGDRQLCPELRRALRQEIPVISVLLADAALPQLNAANHDPELSRLASSARMRLRDGADFGSDFARLLNRICAYRVARPIPSDAELLAAVHELRQTGGHQLADFIDELEAVANRNE